MLPVSAVSDLYRAPKPVPSVDDPVNKRRLESARVSVCSKPDHGLNLQFQIHRPVA